VGTRTGIKT